MTPFCLRDKLAGLKAPTRVPIPASWHTRSSALCLLLAATLTLLAEARELHAQDPLKTLPNNYRLVFDNAQLAVVRAHYGAHEDIPVHDHGDLSTVFVYLNDSGPVRINHADGGESTMRPPTSKGAFRVTAGMAERHSIQNPGDASSDFFRVELKQVRLHLEEPFRGRAPATPLASRDVVEFTSSDLAIERILCVGPAPCGVKAGSAPSLILAVTPATWTQTGAAQEDVSAGGVRWLAAGTDATIRATSDGPAHVLRLLLPATAK